MLLKNQIEFSYFSLQLLECLVQFHPLRANDYDFVKMRGDEAAREFELSLANGYSQQQAIEDATEILFKGLDLSLYTLLKNILWDDFADTIPPQAVEECALRLLPKFEVLINPTGEEVVEIDDEQLREGLILEIKKIFAEGYGI